MLKLLRFLYLFLALLFALDVYAAPVLQGIITSSGVTKNNSTTAVTFSIPLGNISMQCDADVYFTVGGTSSVTTSSSIGMKLFADIEKTMVTSAKLNHIAIIPVSGTANCKVWQLAGETISYRSTSAPRVTANDILDPGRDDAANSYIANAPAGDIGVQLANTGANICLGAVDTQCIRVDLGLGVVYVPGSFAIGSGQNLIADSFYPRQTNLPQTWRAPFGVRLLPVAEGTLPTCGSADIGAGTMLALSGSGHQTRVCFCESDGAGSPAYTWRNLATGVAGNSTTCPTT